MIPSGGIAVRRTHSENRECGFTRPAREKQTPRQRKERRSGETQEQSNERRPLASKESACSGDERPTGRCVVTKHQDIGVRSGFRVRDQHRSNKGKRDGREVAAPSNRRRRGGNGGKRNSTAEELP